MPTFNIISEFKHSKSFRNQSIIDRYDLNVEHLKTKLQGNLDINSQDWNVGLIVGASGTGKSSIAKHIFQENYIRNFQYDENASVLDACSESKTIDEITEVFNSVGLGTAWSWLKPYRILSEGEKMRVDLARALLEDRDLIVFDEFTSVVDRQIGKIVSFCTQKTIRKKNKKFVAVSCHRDVIEWLSPDWIYDTDKQIFFFVKKDTKDQNASLKYMKSQEIIGNYLESITI